MNKYLHNLGTKQSTKCKLMFFFSNFRVRYSGLFRIPILEKPEPECCGEAFEWDWGLLKHRLVWPTHALGEEGREVSVRRSIGQLKSVHSRSRSRDSSSNVKCTLCGKRFREKFRLVLHKRRCRFERRNQGLTRDPDKNGKHTEPDSGLPTLSLDVSRIRGVKPSSRLEKLNPFVCNASDSKQRFGRKEHLDTHRCTEDAKEGLTEACNRIFSMNSNLQMHIGTQDDSDKTEKLKPNVARNVKDWMCILKCDACRDLYPNRNQRLTKRQARARKEGDLYQCDVCYHSYRTAKYSQIHSALHVGAQPCPCPWCRKVYGCGSCFEAHFCEIREKDVKIPSGTSTDRDPDVDDRETETGTETESLPMSLSLHITHESKIPESETGFAHVLADPFAVTMEEPEAEKTKIKESEQG